MIAMETKTRKLSKEKQPMPLYYQLKEILRERIESGEFQSNSTIPTESELMAEYGISRITVIKAISGLVHEGLLYRRPGKGTFVAQVIPKFTAQGMVGLIMHTSGHLFEPMARGIIQGLTEHNRFCIVVDFDNENGKSAEKINSLIERQPDVIVVDGLSSFPFHLLDNYNGKIIFIHRFEGEYEHRASYILSDYFAGGKLVAGYLISLGYKKILFYTYPVSPDHKSQLVLISGARQFFRENNLPEEDFIVFTAEEETLLERITREEKPLAIFSEGDFFASHIYNAAKEINLKIPQDLTIVGYFNTPWAEILHPNLTSVSIREDEISRKVVEMIISDGKKEEKIVLEPKLIIRDSCASRNQQ